MKNWLKVEEAAILMNRSKLSIKVLFRAGLLRAIKIGPFVRIKRKDMEEYLNWPPVKKEKREGGC